MARQVWKFEPTDRWIRASRDGVTIAEQVVWTLATVSRVVERNRSDGP